MTKAYVGKIESGVIKEPGMDVLKRLAGALRIATRELSEPLGIMPIGEDTRQLDSASLRKISPGPLALEVIPTITPSGRIQLRGPLQARQTSPLQPLLHKMPPTAPALDADPIALLGYVDLLDRVIEDRSITDNEIAALGEYAEAHDLSPATMEDLHRSYLTSLVAIALRDGRISPIEREDLMHVATLLGARQFVLDLIESASPAVRSALSYLHEQAHAVGRSVPPIDRRTELAGKTVCFSGESVCGFSREQQELLAAGAGLVPSPRVTKRLDLLVVADRASQSGKSRRAEELGTRRMTERAFWQAIGIHTD